MQAPRSTMVQSFPVTIEDTSHQENLKSQCLLKKKKHTVLDDGINMDDESKISIGYTKSMYIQHCNRGIPRHRCTCDYYKSRILESKLATSRGNVHFLGDRVLS